MRAHVEKKTRYMMDSAGRARRSSSAPDSPNVIDVFEMALSGAISTALGTVLQKVQPSDSSCRGLCMRETRTGACITQYGSTVYIRMAMGGSAL